MYSSMSTHIYSSMRRVGATLCAGHTHRTHIYSSSPLRRPASQTSCCRVPQICCRISDVQTHICSGIYVCSARSSERTAAIYVAYVSMRQHTSAYVSVVLERRVLLCSVSETTAETESTAAIAAAYLIWTAETESTAAESRRSAVAYLL
jgi:hypothetical protein